MKLLKISLIFCMLFTWANAESIKSITGNIIFDINNDGTSEAKLTSDGLAIGDGLSPSANLHLQGDGIITGDLVVGGTAGNSTLEIQGTVGYNTQTISSNTTLSGNSVILVDTSSDNVTVTLPFAGNVMGRLYTIKKTSTSNEVLLNGGGNNIDSGSSYTFTSGNNSSMKVVSNGSQWFVLSKSDSGFSVNGSWTPADITTALWLDASDSSTVLTGGSDNVYQWNDKSGNNDHATQATTAEQPTYNASDSRLNNMPTIGYDQAWKYLTTPSVSVKYVYVVTYYDDPNDVFDLWSAVIRATDDSNIIQGWSGAATWDDGAGVWISRDFYKDGSATATTTALPMSASQWRFQGSSSATKSWGILGRSSSSTNYWKYGAVGEIIFTDGTEDTDTRQKIEGYLAHKWGLEANLPSDHPYKSSAP